MTLRPPRTALLFRADDHWREWARLAIYIASRTWGGGGFAFIPFDSDGSMDPKVLELAVRYDPDYVAVASHPLETWLRVSPDSVHLPPDASIEDLAGQPGIEEVDDPVSRVAAQQLLDACTPLTLAIGGAKAHWEHLSTTGVIRGPFLPSPTKGTGPVAFLAASGSWSGDLALWACVRTGLASPSDERPQPDEGALLRWLISPNQPLDELLLVNGLGTGDTAIGKRNWFQAMSPELATIHTGHGRDPLAIVVGDTADDFALAVLLDRMLGFSLWLTEATLADHFDGAWRPQTALASRIRESLYASDVPVTSASMSTDQLNAVLARLTEYQAPVILGDSTNSASAYPRYAVREPIVSKGGLAGLMLEEHLGTTVTTAVAVAEDGSLSLQSPLVSPVPSVPPVSASGGPAWLVDASIDANPMPSVRRVSSGALVRPDDPIMIRSSREGLTFHAGTFGFVAGGTVLASRLARPAPTFLGIRSWVAAKASDNGLEIRTSRPGVNADLLARRIGSRARLREVVSGPLLPVFRELAVARVQQSSQAFPAGDGVVLHDLRFGTMETIRRLSPALDQETRRALVDELLRSHLMRQGLILGCEECANASFVSLDDLAQSFSCGRCGAMNEFGSARWKVPTDEPPWFYDLHPSARELFQNHGDVPLLAAERLRSTSRRYFDTGELEFRRPGAPKPDFEIDLITYTDDGVSVVEAKSNGSLGSSKERDATIRKRFRAAATIDADRVLFAKSAVGWSPETIARCEEIRSREYRHIELGWIDDLA